MQQYKQYVAAHIRKHRFAFVFIIAVGFLNNIVSFLLPVSIGEFFTLYFHTGSNKGMLLHWLGIQLSSIDQFFIFFGGLILAKAILTLIENYLTFQFGEKFVKFIRELVFSAQMHWSANSLPENSYGKYLLRYSNDLKSVQNYITRGYLEGIKSSLFLISGIFVMFKINAELTYILVFAIIVLIGIIFLIGRWQSTYIVQSRSSRSSLLAFVARQFSRFKRIKEKNREEEMITGFHERSDKLYVENMKYNFSESVLMTLVPVMVFMIIGILLWRMIFLEGTIGAGEGLMMVLILIMMEGGIRRLLKVPTYLNKGRISLQKINKLLTEPNPEIIVVDQA